MALKETLAQITRYKHIKAFYEKYERILIPLTLVLGVFFDAFTFTTLNTTTAFIILGIYLALLGAAIIFMSAYDAMRLPQHHRFLQYLRLWIPLIIQFLFGALLSAAFIFFFFSGTIFVSWPFIFVLVVLMISNDVFRHYYLLPTVQVGVFYFILFTCLSIVLPFVFNTLGVGIFLLSGTISLLLMLGYISLFVWCVPSFYFQRTRFAITVGSIFLVINALFFLNIIPPIPLTIREATLAHDLHRWGAEYELIVEPQSWKDKILPGEVFHKDPSGQVYLYTAIFAPGKLQTTIVHHWQRYDEVTGKWVSHNHLKFHLSGGRKAGFRGYSVKSNVPAGKWRVDVETERGQVLGRVRFEVVDVGEVPGLVRVEK